MHLKKLDMHGFKSFPERVTLSFGPGITGIVGPNGSGKSNISDAVRWVLGEQSAKALRGGKMEDIIFGGTERRKRLSYCEVSLLFDNADGALLTPYTDVEITRRVFRSGESEYLLNQTHCRLRDIVDLFRDTGVGQDGYSLIGQGRVDEILSNKSDERRDVFEEAAGIAKYKSRRSEAEKRMRTTLDNAARIGDILDQYRERLEPLREQSEAARQYLSLRDELKTLEINAFLHRHDAAKTRIDQLGELTTSYAESIKDSETAQRELSEKRESVVTELAELDRHMQAAQLTLLNATNAHTHREGENNLISERIANTKRDIAINAERIAQNASDQSALDGAFSAAHARLDLARAAFDALKTRLSEGENTLTDEENGVITYENRLESDKATLIAQMNRLSDVRSSNTRLTTLRAALSEQLSQLNSTTEENIQRYETELNDAHEAHQAQTRLLETLRNEIETRDRSAKVLTANVEDLRVLQQKDLGAHREMSTRLKVLNEMARDYEGYQQSVKSALAHARQKDLSGVHGAIAALIRVKPELEIAVEMSLGAAMQNIVVDAERDAQTLIDYLRDHRLGRATFLPINAIRGRVLQPNERRVMTMPGCVGVLSELVECDAKYQHIVDHLMGRTVVAEDLTTGIPIMRAGQRAFRLVTLKGDVMHSGGSMTGGSVQSRVTSLLSRKREIAEHQERITHIESAIHVRERDIVALNAQLADALRLLADTRETLHQEDIALTREFERVRRAQSELTARAASLNQRNEEIARLTGDIEGIDAEFSGMESAQDLAHQDHAALRESIVEGQKQLVAMRRHLEEIRAAVTRHKVECASNQQSLNALVAEIRRAESDKTRAATAFDELMSAQEHAETALCRDQSAQVDGENLLGDLLAAREDARDTCTDIETKRAQTQSALNADMRNLDALRQDMDAVTGRHHKSEMQLAHAESDLKQLQDRIFEDYELTYLGALVHKQDNFALNAADKCIEALRGQVRALGPINVGAVDDYREIEAKYSELNQQSADLERAREDLTQLISGLTRKMEKRFREQFGLLNDHFGITFKALFGGGQAQLVLTDENNALECDIDIVAQPPGKKLQMLSLLSGGERALTAIAILFAMLKLKPTPFCILDEIEAALDDANIGNFAEYLAGYAKSTQFVVVTHRKGTMECCDSLYGVTMEEKGVSKMVSVQLS